MPRVGALPLQEHDPHSAGLLRDFWMLGIQFSGEDVQRAIRAYYRSISFFDCMVARVLDALRATGVDENTVIIFTSNHGEVLGERGMWIKKHFFEKSLRIPTHNDQTVHHPAMGAGTDLACRSCPDFQLHFFCHR